MTLNVDALFFLIQAAIPELIKTKGALQLPRAAESCVTLAERVCCRLCCEYQLDWRHATCKLHVHLLHHQGRGRHVDESCCSRVRAEGVHQASQCPTRACCTAAS